MEASDVIHVLRVELDRFIEQSEDPTSEPLTLSELATILERAAREAALA